MAHSPSNSDESPFKDGLDERFPPWAIVERYIHADAQKTYGARYVPTPSRSPSPPLKPLRFHDFHDTSSDIPLDKDRDPHASGSECPEGGREAWTVVFGVSCAVAATFGFVNAWGVFQAYYEQLLPEQTPSNIAWIGSAQYALVFMPGIIFGRLFDMGYLRLPLFFASLMLVVCTILIAECTKYWQFLLVQGFLIGISSGIIFNLCLGVIPHWFNKKSGIAFGCMALGSSIGGTIFPIALKNLITHLSFQWTVRIVALVIGVLLTISNFAIKRRLGPKKDLGPFFSLSAFKDLVWTFYAFSLMVAFLGLYTCLTYISLGALLAGLDLDFAFYLIPITNASSIIGRLGGGLLADHFGHLNVAVPSQLLAAIMTYAWPYATTKSGLLAIAVFYGIFSGVLVALMGPPVREMTPDVREAGMRFGMTNTILSFGALAGPPISGAILDGAGSFKPVGAFAGTAVLASAVMLGIVRLMRLRRWWGKI